MVIGFVLGTIDEFVKYDLALYRLGLYGFFSKQKETVASHMQQMNR